MGYELIILLGIGAVGGAVRALLGYEQQSDVEETFNYGKAGKSILRAAVVGASVVMGATALTGGAISESTYILAFFTAIGSDVLTKEGAGTIMKK